MSTAKWQNIAGSKRFFIQGHIEDLKFWVLGANKKKLSFLRLNLITLLRIPYLGQIQSQYYQNGMSTVFLIELSEQGKSIYKQKTVLFEERFSSRYESVLRLFFWPYCVYSVFDFLKFLLPQKSLRHTQLNVCEKEELPYFLYLIQIFGLYVQVYNIHRAQGRLL